mmetsp:Transcript_120780/g.225801  ORF Transcript_120780/g.225801 Transcript_120780/m.225801 type:complete len:604 (+) Transcript_120780:94-1905(+)
MPQHTALVVEDKIAATLQRRASELVRDKVNEIPQQEPLEAGTTEQDPPSTDIQLTTQTEEGSRSEHGEADEYVIRIFSALQSSQDACDQTETVMRLLQDLSVSLNQLLVLEMPGSFRRVLNCLAWKKIKLNRLNGLITLQHAAFRELAELFRTQSEALQKLLSIWGQQIYSFKSGLQDVRNKMDPDSCDDNQWLPAVKHCMVTLDILATILEAPKDDKTEENCGSIGSASTTAILQSPRVTNDQAGDFDVACRNTYDEFNDAHDDDITFGVGQDSVGVPEESDTNELDVSCLTQTGQEKCEFERECDESNEIIIELDAQNQSAVTMCMNEEGFDKSNSSGVEIAHQEVKIRVRTTAKDREEKMPKSSNEARNTSFPINKLQPLCTNNLIEQGQPSCQIKMPKQQSFGKKRPSRVVSCKNSTSQEVHQKVEAEGPFWNVSHKAPTVSKEFCGLSHKVPTVSKESPDFKSSETFLDCTNVAAVPKPEGQRPQRCYSRRKSQGDQFTLMQAKIKAAILEKDSSPCTLMDLVAEDPDDSSLLPDQVRLPLRRWTQPKPTMSPSALLPRRKTPKTLPALLGRTTSQGLDTKAEAVGCHHQKRRLSMTH